MDLERQKRVISMMITMHSILSSKYSRLSSFFEVTLLSVAVIINTLIFADADVITKVTLVNEETSKDDSRICFCNSFFNFNNSASSKMEREIRKPP